MRVRAEQSDVRETDTKRAVIMTLILVLNGVAQIPVLQGHSVAKGFVRKFAKTSVTRDQKNVREMDIGVVVIMMLILVRNGVV